VVLENLDVALGSRPAATQALARHFQYSALTASPAEMKGTVWSYPSLSVANCFKDAIVLRRKRICAHFPGAKAVAWT
jgi:hypothetical protein